jgi:hypothetical protein
MRPLQTSVLRKQSGGSAAVTGAGRSRRAAALAAAIDPGTLRDYLRGGA